MKIEKLSDNQIRCTLNKSDLASRELKISELAYGSEKAKDLFRDMMQQASYEFGFEADDIPLMIEAIPVSADCIILIITKVDDPEELDTRFSKFAPTSGGDDEDDSDLPYDDTLDTLSSSTVIEDNGADDVINLFSKVKDYLAKSIDSKITEVAPDNNSKSDANSFIPFNQSLKDSAVTPVPAAPVDIESESDDAKGKETAAELNISRIFSFDSLNSVNDVAGIIAPMYTDSNSLYKDIINCKYYLVVNKIDCTPAVFNKVCNILSEYGNKEHFTYATESFFEEHYDTIISDNALQVLSSI